MNNVRIELNRAAVNELLKSEWIAEVCKDLATDMKDQCGEGYGISIYTGKNRVNVSVFTETEEAMQDNLENNTILHALGGGGR